MRTKRLHIVVRTEQEEIEEVASVMEKASQGASAGPRGRLVFRSVDDLRRMLTSERLRILHLIRHEKPQSVYELAQLAGRSRRAVTLDLNVLEDLGLVEVKRTKGPGRGRSIPHVSYGRIEIAMEV